MIITLQLNYKSRKATVLKISTFGALPIFPTFTSRIFLLWQGYGGADEAKMLQRHFNGTSAKIGVGSNRAATASCFLNKYGRMDHSIICSRRLFSENNIGSPLDSSKIGVAILDDGMQVTNSFLSRHLSCLRLFCHHAMLLFRR